VLEKVGDLPWVCHATAAWPSSANVSFVGGIGKSGFPFGLDLRYTDANFFDTLCPPFLWLDLRERSFYFQGLKFKSWRLELALEGQATCKVLN